MEGALLCDWIVGNSVDFLRSERLSWQSARAKKKLSGFLEAWSADAQNRDRHYAGQGISAYISSSQEWQMYCGTCQVDDPNDRIFYIGPTMSVLIDTCTRLISAHYESVEDVELLD